MRAVYGGTLSYLIRATPPSDPPALPLDSTSHVKYPSTTTRNERPGGTEQHLDIGGDQLVRPRRDSALARILRRTGAPGAHHVRARTGVQGHTVFERACSKL